MSKKDKELKKLLHKKTLSSDEAVRLLELNGWIKEKRKSGTSHQQFVHPVKKGKVTVPAERKTLPDDTRKDILNQAGLSGE